MALDSLQEYGNTFQLKIITNLLKPIHSNNNGIDFLSQVFDVLSPDLFESDANQFIISHIIDYYKKYKKSPTLDFFRSKTGEISDDVLKSVIMDNLKDIYNYMENSSDLDYVRDEFVAFCRNQIMKDAIIKSVDLLQSKEYDGIKKLIEKATQFDVDQEDLGHDYLNDIEDRLLNNPRKNVIPTQWAPINEIMDGGVGEGDLMIFVGGPGSGKCVGPNTNIDIEYEEIGIEDEDGNIQWYKPWDKILYNGKNIFAWQINN